MEMFLLSSSGAAQLIIMQQQWATVICEWEIAYVLFPHNQSRTFHSEIWAKKQRSSIHPFPSLLLFLLYYVSHFQISRWWWPMLSKPLWTGQWPSAILAKCLVLKLCGRCKAKTLVKRMLHMAKCDGGESGGGVGGWECFWRGGGRDRELWRRRSESKCIITTPPCEFCGFPLTLCLISSLP